MIVVVWGVSGSGKTTVATQLGELMSWEVLDADDFHPTSNVEKMRAGIPLTDADRKPWLDILAEQLNARLQRKQSAVVACSALKQRYRTHLNVDPAQMAFVHLQGNFELIAQRLAKREHQYMNNSLLQSQFDALEPAPEGYAVGIEQPVADICAQICSKLGLAVWASD